MKNQKGIAQIFIILVLLVGILITVYVVQQRTHILPSAHEDAPVVETNSDLNQPVSPPQGHADDEILIGGFVFEDTNGDGIRQYSNEYKEPGVSGAEIMVMQRGDGRVGMELDHPFLKTPVRVTDAHGFWYMLVKKPDIDQDYTLCREEPCLWAEVKVPGYGWEVIGDSTKPIPLTSSGKLMDMWPSGGKMTDNEAIRFGIRGTLNISGTVFKDKNQNGLRDSDEFDEGIPGVWIMTGSSNDNTNSTDVKTSLYAASTRSDGSFIIEHVPPLGKFSVMASAACPIKITTPNIQTSQSPLGPQTADFTFGAIFDGRCASPPFRLY